MGFFTRTKEAVDGGRAASAPFETVRRSPRNSRKRAPADPRFDAGAPLDPAETIKTRARRRLIGAVALALAAIVFVPMLFDRAPAPPSDDIALQIPDRDTPFEGRRGVPDASRGPLKAAGDLPLVSASPGPVEQPSTAPNDPAGQTTEKSVDKPVEVEAPKAIAPQAPPRVDKPIEAKKPEPSAEKAIEKPTEKPTEKPRAPAVVSTVPSTASTGDDPHAVAALEGKSDPVVTSSNAKGYAVQIAAYAAQEKARGMRDQLVAGGLRSYVESTSTPQGLRYRLRLGPFPSREAADKARAKLKTMKLDGSIVPL